MKTHETCRCATKSHDPGANAPVRRDAGACCCGASCSCAECACRDCACGERCACAECACA